MQRFAVVLVLLAALALGVWLALGGRGPRAPAAATDDAARSAEAQSSPALVNAPELAPAAASPVEAEPAASNAREAVAGGEESERSRPTHADADSITGRVLWPDGTPAKALVSAFDESAEKLGNQSSREDEEQQTTEDGRFQIIGSGAGPFLVHARSEHSARTQSALDADGRSGNDDEFWVGEQEHVAPGTSDLVLTLSSGLEVSGRLVDERGSSVDDFVVYAQRVGRTVPWSNATNTFSHAFRGSGGGFVLAGFSPGAWELSVEAKGYADSEAIPIDVPLAAPLELVLLHCATVRGTVLDPRGAPIAGAKVSAAEDRKWSSHRNGGVPPSDESGAFAIDWLLPGHVTLLASGPGCAPSEPLALELAPGQAQDGLVLRLRAPGTIAGEVLGPGSIPEAEQFVYMHEKDRDGHSDGARTDAKGRFAFIGVPAGEYSIESRTSGGFPLRAETQLGDGEDARVRLGPPGAGLVKLHGRVTIGAQAPGKIQLSASHERGSFDRQSCAVQCAADGSYDLVVPGAGRYELSVALYGGDIFSWTTAVDVPQVPELACDIDVPVGRVRGRVTSRDGTALADMAVRGDGHAADGSFESFRTHTDSDGHYELLAGAGPLTVIVGGNDWPSNENVADWRAARAPGLVLTASQELDGIDFVLSPGGTLLGRVRRSDGGSLRQVLILDYGEKAERMIASTDKGGRFQSHGLEPGTLLVGARTGGVVTKPVSVTIEPGKTTEIEIELAPAPSAPGH